LCVFIYVDCKFIPQESRTEAIQEKKKYKVASRRSRSTHYNYEIITDKSTHDVTSSFYNEVSENDTVQIFYFVITHSIQKIKIEKEDSFWVFENNYLNVSFGMFFLWILSIGSIFTQLAYNKLPYEYTKRNLSYLVFIASLVAFFFHLST
jgi:hypothetical protein